MLSKTPLAYPNPSSRSNRQDHFSIDAAITENDGLDVALRIRATDERIFTVLYGGVKGASKPVSSELVVLSTIATCRASGISSDKLFQAFRTSNWPLKDLIITLIRKGLVVEVYDNTSDQRRYQLARFTALENPSTPRDDKNPGGGSDDAEQPNLRPSSGHEQSDENFANGDSSMHSTSRADQQGERISPFFSGQTGFVPPDVALTASPIKDAASDRTNPREARPKSHRLGRPRKFASGTEAFWREQFILARRQANPTSKKLDKAGLSDDPISVALYAQRPAKFDETLVKAVELGLPIPGEPKEITQEWIDRTNAFQDRPTNNLYLSPTGVQANRWLATKPRSQIFVLKTTRLKELDLSAVHHVASVRFLTSSAAHTLHYRRFYPSQVVNRPKYAANAPAVLKKLQISTAQDPNRRYEAGITTTLVQGRDDDYLPSSPLVTRLMISRKRLAPQVSEMPRKRRRVQQRIEEHVPFRESLRGGSTQPTIESQQQEENSGGLSPPLTTRRAARQARRTISEYASSFNENTTLQHDDTLTTRENPFGFSYAGASHSDDDLFDDGAIDADSDDTEFHEDLPKERSFRVPLPLPPKRARNVGRGGRAGIFRKDIIMQIIDECSGAIPYNLAFPWQTFGHRLQASESAEAPDLNAMKRTIKLLCDSGRVKQMKFSLRSKRGLMITRTMIVRSDIEATDQVVVGLQRSIELADPSDFIPPELSAAHSSPLPQDSSSMSTYVQSPLSQPRTINNGFLLPSSSKIISGSQPHRAPPLKSLPRAKSRSEIRKITWAKPGKKQRVPGSLQEILKDVLSRVGERSKQDRSREYTFEEIIDAVSQWELLTFNKIQFDLQHNSFINLVAPIPQFSPLRVTPSSWLHPEAISTPSTFDLTLQSEKSSISAPYVVPFDDVEESDTDLRRRSINQRRRNKTKTPLADRYLNNTEVLKPRQKRRPKREPPSVLAPAPPKRSRAPLSDPRKPLGAATPDGSHAQLKRRRGIHYLRAMSEDQIYRIAISIIIVRTLSGGLEKYIDWGLVSELNPAEDEQFLRDRWRTLSTRYRSDVRGLTESLQERYPTALENGEVPEVDFDDLRPIYQDTNGDRDDDSGTDWFGITEWAVQNLDRYNIKRVGDLPESREDLLGAKEFAFEEFKGMRELLAYNVNATVPRKEEALGAIPFVTPMALGHMAAESNSSDKGRSMRQTQLQMLPEIEESTDNELTFTRSWVFAVVLTTPGKWNAQRMRKKLLTLAPTEAEMERCVNRALQTLQRDKAIVRRRDGNKNATVLQGGWEVSLKFYEQFESKRMINANMLRDAARYKRDVLDPALSDSDAGRLLISKDDVVDDGHMVALVNMCAAGRVCMRPGTDVPRSRYGLDWQSVQYQTRVMDRSLLRFGVEIHPGPKPYVAGDAMQRHRLPIPRGDMDDLIAIGRGRARGGKIPMWFDILGNFSRDVWDMTVAAVVGLVSLRAGVDAVEIRRNLNWGISAWELALLLDWMERCGFVTREGKGWTTGEWWWLVLAEAQYE